MGGEGAWLSTAFSFPFNYLQATVRPPGRLWRLQVLRLADPWGRGSAAHFLESAGDDLIASPTSSHIDRKIQSLLLPGCKPQSEW